MQSQNEIENILDNNVFYDCVVGGDVNCDFSRYSGFTNSMSDLVFSQYGRSFLQTSLTYMQTPDSLGRCDVTYQSVDHTHERDKHVLDILCTLIETSYNCIPLSGKVKTLRIQIKYPGWKELLHH